MLKVFREIVLMLCWISLQSQYPSYSPLSFSRHASPFASQQDSDALAAACHERKASRTPLSPTLWHCCCSAPVVLPSIQVESEALWMRAQPATSEFALNVSMARRGTGRGGSLAGLDGFDDDGTTGGTRDFMFGFAMGAFLGVIMLLWMWEAAVPRKQKLGILAGVTFKHTVTMVQTAVSSRSSGDEDG